MADNKYERYIQLFPKTFRPRDGDEVLENLAPEATVGKTIAQLWNENVPNPVLNAVLRGFAQGDLDVSTALEATKASLFVKTAEAQQLDVIASSLGVSRPGSLGLSDSAFQNLVPPLSLGAKQVRSAFYNAMDAFYGPEFSRANLITLNTDTSLFDLRLADSLSFTVDGGEVQTITIRTTSGIANVGAGTTPGQATALELNNLLKDNLTGVTSEILVDPITKIETVRVLTTTPGLRGSLQFSVNRTAESFNIPGDSIVAPPPGGLNNRQVNIIRDFTNRGILPGDTANFDLGALGTTSRIVDSVATMTNEPFGSGNGFATVFTFTTDSTAIQARAGEGELTTITGDRPVPTPILFSLEKAELLKQAQRTAVYEITPNNVIIELPAVLPSLQRGLKGALHVHNGPLLNNLIFRGEETNFVIPEFLFENTPDNIYNVTSDQDWVTFPDPSNRIIKLNPPAGLDLDVYSVRVDNKGRSDATTFSLNIPNGDSSNENSYSFAGGPNALRVSIPTIGQIVTIELFRPESVNPTPSNATIPLDVNGFGSDSMDGTAFRTAVADALRTFTQFFSSVTVDGVNVNITLTNNGETATPEIEMGSGNNGLSSIQNFVSGIIREFESFTFFVRVDNRIAPAADQQIWEGAFIFDPNGTQTAFTVSGQSAVITGDAITGATTLAAGRVFPRVNVEASTNNLPDESGFAVIGFGSATQEPALIRYRGKASNEIIELDPSFVFTRNQPSGTYINIVSSATPFIPDRVGSDYPIYLTSSTEARIVVQNILQSLAAAGVVVTFVVLAPEYKYLIDNPYLITDDAPIV